ncbi:hypothetical protein BaRGS_00029794 [Batillaria attramentaria]|uniref:DUF4430 domain-containing protein n=1 Tax=Batillaria attramentaria TaxID=370345 RepID=A0ABD0JV23_9CAEN
MAQNTLLIIAFVCFGVVAVSDAWWFRRQKCNDRRGCKAVEASCEVIANCSKCNLLEKPDRRNFKTVTLRATNFIKDPTFETEVTLERTRSKTLFYMLEEAAETNSDFRFTATYFGVDLGYFIEAVNRVFANSSASQFWNILDGNLDPTPVGKFTASYDYASHPGYFINAINQVWETWDVDQSYWEILDGDLKHTPVGTAIGNFRYYTGEHFHAVAGRAQNTLLIIAFVCFGVVAVSDAWLFRREKCDDRRGCKAVEASSDEIANCSKCNLLEKPDHRNFKTVTLRATNFIKDPTFETEVTLERTRSKTLFYMLEEAAETNSDFRFTATYFGVDLGYFIEAVNRVFANSSASQFWNILDGNLDPTPVGKFTASYDYASHPGYFINAINQVWETWDVDQSYWEILDGDLKHTPVGTAIGNFRYYTGEHFHAVAGMAQNTLLIIAFVCFGVVAVSDAWLFRREKCDDRRGCKAVEASSDEIANCSKCNLLEKPDHRNFKTVTLRATNFIKDPTFETEVTLERTRSKTLFYMLEEAAETNSDFRFTATYFGVDLGYFIEAVNRVFANSSASQFWNILDGNLDPTPVGKCPIHQLPEFTASYDYASHPGYFINAINQVWETWDVDQSYWEILDGDLKHTPVGTAIGNFRYYTGEHFHTAAVMAQNTLLIIAFCNLLEKPDSRNFKTVTLRATNFIKDPTFETEVTLERTRSKTLFYMLEEAAETNSDFRFTATYFGVDLGYFIEAVNRVFANSSASQFWNILDGNLDPTPVGKFTASYDYAGHPGYFINAINQVWETWDVDQSYWEILDGDLKHTPVGASSYVPEDGETVTFNLTTWDGNH